MQLWVIKDSSGKVIAHISPEASNLEDRLIELSSGHQGMTASLEEIDEETASPAEIGASLNLFGR